MGKRRKAKDYTNEALQKMERAANHYERTGKLSDAAIKYSELAHILKDEAYFKYLTKAKRERLVLWFRDRASFCLHWSSRYKPVINH